MLGLALLLATGVALYFAYQRWTRPAPLPRRPDTIAPMPAEESELLAGIVNEILDFTASEVEARLASVPRGEQTRLREIVYFSLVSRAVSDDYISDDEDGLLEHARAVLGISEARATELLGAIVLPTLTADLREAMADRRVTPAEIAAIQERAARLRVSLDLQGEGVELLERFERYALWEIGSLPVAESPVALKRGELCHYVTTCIWHERRMERRRVGQSGFVASVPIMRGLSYRVGTVTPIYAEKETIKQVDTGGLVFTSERVIFVGQRGSKSFPWASVLAITPWSDAIEFMRSSGKHPVLAVPDAEEAAVMATAILAQT